MSAFVATFRRDFALLWGGGGALAPLGYFLGATLLTPLAMGPERTLLAAAGPPLVWIAAALAVLATLERLFQADLEDGSLDQMLLSRAPLEALVFAKGAALWCAVGLPLALAGAPAAIPFASELRDGRSHRRLRVECGVRLPERHRQQAGSQSMAANACETVPPHRHS